MACRNNIKIILFSKHASTLSSKKNVIILVFSYLMLFTAFAENIRNKGNKK